MITINQTKKNDITEERNKKKRLEMLNETDVYALSDVTMTDAMKAYRQALRDITLHSNWPNLEDANWPTKP
tara:strand:+ start:3843 stop:4055 length:213 start_codon:yes stop_codon:yes gene_type:complete